MKVAPRSPGTFLAAIFCVVVGSWPAAGRATEVGFTLYNLGSGAVGAGQLPPDGIYFTTLGVYQNYQRSITVPFGGSSVANARLQLGGVAGNGLFVLPDEILGGRAAFSITAGFLHSQLSAGVIGGVNGQKSVGGWGATDTAIQSAISWTVSPIFSHKITLTENIPTGRYDAGFYPNIGIHRLGADISWGFTLIEPSSKLELSGTLGLSYEGYNPLTQYRSGNGFHAEAGLSKHFENGFRIGVIGYRYDQLTPDGGSGANFGPFRTHAMAVGPSAGYTTMIDGHLVIFGLQATREVYDKNRLRLTNTVFSTTVKF